MSSGVYSPGICTFVIPVVKDKILEICCVNSILGSRSDTESRRCKTCSYYSTVSVTKCNPLAGEWITGKIRSSSNKKITSIFRKLVRISRFFCKYLFISKTRVLDSSPYQFELKIPSQALDNLGRKE